MSSHSGFTQGMQVLVSLLHFYSISIAFLNEILVFSWLHYVSMLSIACTCNIQHAHHSLHPTTILYTLLSIYIGSVQLWGVGIWSIRLFYNQALQDYYKSSKTFRLLSLAFKELKLPVYQPSFLEFVKRTLNSGIPIHLALDCIKTVDQLQGIT